MRKTLPLIFLLTGLAQLCTAADERPNIVLIMADDVGADAIGCYGGSTYATPNIDRLATRGTKFENCFSMPSCHPTRVCLLTGRYPRHIKNPRWGTFPKPLEGKTVASLLRKAGYATAVTGKWQLTLLGKDKSQPHRMGFDTYALFGWHEGPRYYQPMIWQDGKLRDDVKDRYGPDVYSDVLIEFMKRNSDGPFFAYFPMALCHDVTDDLKAPTPYGPHGRYDSFAEMMSEMDRIVGKVVQAVERMKPQRRTLVLFTGDNGTAARSIIRHKDGKYIRDPVFTTFRGRRVQGGKTQLTDGGTHVPLIAYWIGPGKSRPTSAALVDFSDFLPTLCELAGAPLPEGTPLDGVSFARELSSTAVRSAAGTPLGGLLPANALGPTAPQSRTFAYSEAKGRFFVRDARWKLYNDGRFFDVANDRSERRPLDTKQLPEAATAAHRALASSLARLKAKN